METTTIKNGHVPHDQSVFAKVDNVKDIPVHSTQHSKHPLDALTPEEVIHSILHTPSNLLFG